MIRVAPLGSQTQTIELMSNEKGRYHSIGRRERKRKRERQRDREKEIERKRAALGTMYFLEYFTWPR